MEKLRNMSWPSRFLICTVPTKILLFGSGRLLYPFLNFLTVDWGLTRAELGYVLAAGELGGIPGGFLGTLTDIYGNRIVGIISFIVFFISSWLLLLPPTLGGLIFSRLLSAIAFSVYIVASQSTLLRITSKEFHGWVTGISETGWALSILVLIPILAIVYENIGWRWAFAVFCMLIAPFVVEIIIDFPKDDEKADDENKSISSSSSSTAEDEENQEDQEDQEEQVEVVKVMQTEQQVQSFKLTNQTTTSTACKTSQGDVFERILKSRYWISLTSKGARTFNLGSLFFSLSHNLMFISFANWASVSHGLSTSEMGGATFAVGFAELAGSLGVIFFSDRIGLYRSLFTSLFFYGGFILLFLFVADISFAAGLTATCLVFFAGEFTIVTKIATVDKFVAEELRGSLLGIQFQAHFIGRAIGAFIAEPLWQMNEMKATCAASFSFTVLSILFVGYSFRYFPKSLEASSETKTTTADDDDNDENHHHHQQQQQHQPNQVELA